MSGGAAATPGGDPGGELGGELGGGWDGRAAGLGAALAVASRGWPVFPLRPYSKLPAVRNWQRRACTDPDRVRTWWAAVPYANVGLACGPAGLVVVDLDAAGHTWSAAAGAHADGGSRGGCGGHGDRMGHGRDGLAALAAAAGQVVPDTYTVGTPCGEHLYFAAPAGVALRNTCGVLAARIDTRAGGGYVVAAGSVLREAGRSRCYRVVRDAPLAPLPGWIAAALRPAVAPSVAAPAAGGGTTPARSSGWAGDHLSGARVRGYVAAAVAGEARAVARARPGTRNHTLFRAAASLGELLGAGVLEEDAATGALLAAASAHLGVEGFTLGEARRAIGNGLRRGRRNPRRLID